YVALIYLSPLICGAIVDRWVGHYRGILLGGFIILLGHLSLLLVHFIPYFLPDGHASFIALLNDSGLSLGKISLPVETKAELLRLGATENIIQAYHAVGISFHLALGLIIMGTGFFKPSAVSLISRLYKGQMGSQREEAFTLQYMAINIGSFAAPILAGGIGEYFGWHYGFSVAAIGMALGLGLFVSMSKKYLPADLYQKQALKKVSATTPLSGKSDATAKQYLTLIFLVFILSFYWTIYEQWGGLISIFTSESVNRHVGGVEISATAFQSLNPMFIILLSPLMIIALKVIDRKYGENRITAFHKLALSFVALGVGFGCLYIGASDASANESGKGAVSWLIAAYFFIAFSELLLAPVALALFTQIAPPSLLAVSVGVFYVTNSIGAFFSGYVGAWAIRTDIAIAFAALAILAALFAPILIGLNQIIFQKKNEI
ncbi:MAG: MFS transporter, partial [Pseudomonadota bacterium]